MKRSELLGHAPYSYVAAALLAGCGGSQPPIGAAGTLSQAAPIRAPSSYEVLHRFSLEHRRPTAAPSSGLVVANGTLFGTTVDYPAEDTGTVYSLSTAGLHKTLYTFRRHSAGTRPFGTLLDVNGILYGTTALGGSAGVGTVFSLSASGVETVLYSFQGGSDGAHPEAGLIDVNGTLYGTTALGGSAGVGTVFSLSASGVEMVLYSFQGYSDGALPEASLIDVNGTLYGTTLDGGSDGLQCNYSPFPGCGTVFSVSTSGAYKQLYSFHGCPDGAAPSASLIDVNGTLYGTTIRGGSCSYAHGTVYTITASGSERVLYSFKGGSDGANPQAGLYYLDGTLYGTTSAGGTGTCKSPWYNTCGVVFSLSAAGKEQVLHDFGDGQHDGANPSFGSLVSVNGTLYGTTTYGGGPGCVPWGCGIAYALTP